MPGCAKAAFTFRDDAYGSGFAGTDVSGAEHNDERLRLLHHNGGDEVVLERLREEDRRRAGGARADEHRRDDVPRPRPPRTSAWPTTPPT